MVRKVARGSMTVRWRAKDGNNGDDAVTYDIVPNISVINATADGVIDSDGIIVKAYRTEGSVRSDNILPEDDYPDEEAYYFVEYRKDGGTWMRCDKFYHPTGPEGDIEWVPEYGIGYSVVNTTTRGIAFRLKHSDNPNVVLKEIPPIKVVKDGESDFNVQISSPVIVVPVNSSQELTGNSFEDTVQINAFYGTRNVTSQCTITQSHYDTDITVTISNGTVTVHMAGDTYYNTDNVITFTVTHPTYGTRQVKLTIQLSIQGIQGIQGIDGCIRRIREWKVGEEYRNDKALSSGIRYIDIAVKKSNGSVTLACICLKTHTATAALEPQDSAYTTVDGVRYWEKLNNLGPIYTPFIWADDAIFQFTQTNQLVVLKANNGGVNVALGGGTWPLWIGAVLAGLSGTTPLAPFQVKDNGEFWSTNAHIKGEVEATSGKFTGEIQATSGKFEGTVKAQLFYGKTIVVTSNSYTINPETAPGSTFYYENPTANTWIYLPSPTTYDGMEINIYIRQDDESKLSLRHHVSPNGNTLCYKMNIYNIVITTNPYKTAAVENYNKPVLTTTGGLRIIPGCFYTFKAMNNCWHAIKGMFTGE